MAAEEESKLKSETGVSETTEEKLPKHVRRLQGLPPDKFAEEVNNILAQRDR